MSNQQKLSKLKRLYGDDVLVAEAFVRYLKIPKSNKLYPAAVEWAIIEIINNQKNTLTKREKEQFEKDTREKRVGPVHKKIIKEIEKLYAINEILDGKEEINTSRLDSTSQSIPAAAATNTNQKIEKPEIKLESNLSRVERGGSVTLLWSSKNATRIKRSNIPGITTKTPVNGSIEVSNILRRRDFYITVIGPGGLAEDKIRVLIETQAYLKGKEKDIPESENSPPEEEIDTTSIVSPSSRRTSRSGTSSILSSTGNANSLNSNIILSIDKTLSGISKILLNQLKLKQSIFDSERRGQEFRLRQMREDEMEGSRGDSSTSGKMRSGIEKVLSPFKTIIDKVIKFLYFTFLGKVFTDVMRWFNDPKNKEKIGYIGKFISDFWPLILGAALYFLTPLGGFINGTLGILKNFIKVAGKVIPKLIKVSKLLLSAPIAKAALALTGVASLFGLAAFLANKVTGQGDAAKIITERGSKVNRGEALDIRGVDTMQEKYKTPGEFQPSGILKGAYFTGGSIFSGQVTEKDGKKVSGAGKDTQAFPIKGGGMAVLQPGETVLQPGVRESIIKDKGFDVLSYNKGPNANRPQSINSSVKLMSTGGIVGSNSNNARIASSGRSINFSGLSLPSISRRTNNTQSTYSAGNIRNISPNIGSTFGNIFNKPLKNISNNINLIPNRQLFSSSNSKLNINYSTGSSKFVNSVNPLFLSSSAPSLEIRNVVNGNSTFKPSSNYTQNIPRPISRLSNNISSIVLPPIVKNTGSVPSSPGSGNELPVFSAIPSGIMEIRNTMANIYGIIV